MKIRDITYCSMMVAIIAAFSLIPPITIPLLPVPISLQTMTVMLAGSLLGKKLSTISILIFLLLVAAGLPLLAGGRGGIAIFFGPTAGYLLSWPVSSFAIGWLLEQFNKLNFWKYLLANLIGGMLVMNVIGAVALSFIAHIPVLKALLATIIFFPGDILKAIVVSLIVDKLYKMKMIRFNN